MFAVYVILLLYAYLVCVLSTTLANYRSFGDEIIKFLREYLIKLFCEIVWNPIMPFELGCVKLCM